MIVLAGTVFGLGFGLLARVIPARLLGASDYGLFVLGLTIVLFSSIFGGLGINEGIARELPRFDSREEKNEIVRAGFLLALVVSVTAGVFLFLFGSWISSTVFDDPGLTPVLRVFAFLVPFVVFKRTIISVFRGYGKSIERVILRNFSSPLLRVLFLSSAIALGLGVTGAAIGWLVGVALTACLGLYLVWKRTPTSFIDPLTVPGNDKYRMLLAFSLPLMFSVATSVLLNHVDNLLIGYYLTSNQVGIYDSAFTVSRLILAPASSFAFLFLPTISSLHADNDLGAMRNLYKLVTKWIVILVIPVFLMLFAFPATVLGAVFGPSYTQGAIVLRIITFGFFIRVLAGLCGETVKSLGKSQLILYVQVVIGGMNIGLNLLLIPTFGILGAALASAASFGLGNGIYLVILYRDIGIQPFSVPLAKALFSGALAMGILYISIEMMVDLTFGMLLPFGFGFSILYLSLFLLLGGVQKEDIDVIEVFEQRTNVKVPYIRSFVR